MIRTSNIKNNVTVIRSTEEKNFAQAIRATKKGLSTSRPAGAAGKHQTSSQPPCSSYRKNRPLRTTKTAPLRAVYSAPKVVLRVREEGSERWAHGVHNVSSSDELEGRLHAGHRSPFSIVTQPVVKRHGLFRMTSQLLAYGRKQKLATQTALLAAASRPRAGSGLPSGDRLYSRVVSGCVSPRWLTALRQQSHPNSDIYLYRRSAFSKVRRVRLVHLSKTQVISFTLRRGALRYAGWLYSLRRVKTAACPPRYVHFKYRRSSLRCKSSGKRIRRSWTRRLRSKHRSLVRRVARWRTRPVAGRLRKKLLLSRYARIQERQVLLKRVLLKRARVKRACMRRVRNKRALAKKAKRGSSLPRYPRRKQLKRPPKPKSLQRSREHSFKKRPVFGNRPRINTHKRLRSYHQMGRLMRRQGSSYLTSYKESRAATFLKCYRACFPARFGLRARKVLRSPWWRTSRTWFFGVRPYFIPEIRRAVRRSRPRYRLRRKIRRSRYRRARRHARTVWGRANYLRYYRKGRYRQYYRRRRLSFTGLVRKGLPRDIKTLIRRAASRYRYNSVQRWQQSNTVLLRRRVSRSRRRVIRRAPARRHVVRKHRNRRFPRTRRVLGKFLLKSAGKAALWLRIAALQGIAPSRTVRIRFTKKEPHPMRLVAQAPIPVKPSSKKVLDLRKTKGGMVYGLRTIFSELAFTRPARRQIRLRLHRAHAKSLARLRGMQFEWKQRAQLWVALKGSQVAVGCQGSRALAQILSKAKYRAQLAEAENAAAPGKAQFPLCVTRYRPKGQTAALRSTRRRSLLSRLTADIHSFERSKRSTATQRKVISLGSQPTKNIMVPKQR